MIIVDVESDADDDNDNEEEDVKIYLEIEIDNDVNFLCPIVVSNSWIKYNQRESMQNFSACILTGLSYNCWPGCAPVSSNEDDDLDDEDDDGEDGDVNENDEGETNQIDRSQFSPLANSLLYGSSLLPPKSLLSFTVGLTY